jgi:hypothetical protein
MNTQLINASVEWWAEKIQNGVWDNGDSSALGGMAFGMANMLAMKSRESITPEKITTFKEFLSELINRRLSERPSLSLRVDYHPCQILSAAADVAGIPHGVFPCKSGMSICISDEVVKAYCGYGKQSEIIYQQDAEEAAQ